MRVTKRRMGVIAAIAVVTALSVYGLMPKPLTVETAEAVRGPMQVAIEEDGITRVRERYDVTAPVAGRLRRVALHAGDHVKAGQTLLTIEALPLSVKERTQLEARLESSRRLSRETEALVASARAAADLSAREQRRLRALAAESIASREALDQAVAAERQARENLAAARHRSQAAAFDVEVARAALSAGDSCCVNITAPSDGFVLRVLQESESVVPAGSKIMEIGDPATLEIAIDVLSDDAVKIQPGQRVVIADWGGPKPLEARVRLVEPSAFTKISALGVEEQRVNVLADLTSRPPEIGDQFRVDARVIVWEGNVVKVPATAIFGRSGAWAAYVVDGRRARLRRLSIGHLGNEEAEVIDGLRPGDRVVLHPSDQLHDGVAVRSGK